MGWSWAALTKRPIFFPVLFYLMGNAAADAWLPLGISAPFVWAGVVLVTLFVVWRGERPGAFLGLLVAATLAGLAGALEGLEADLPPTGAHRVEGEIEAMQSGAESTGLTLRVAAVDGEPSHFRAVISGDGPAPSTLFVGQRVLLDGRLKPLVMTSNDGEFDRSRVAMRRGQIVTGSFSWRRLVVLSAPTAWRTWLARAHASLTAHAEQVIDDAESRALVLTLAAGERAALGPELEEVFARSGLAHVLSVSGLHVAVVAFSLFAALRWLLTRRMSRWARLIDARAVAAPAALPLVWGYVLFTGWQAPAVRSAVMCSLVLLGWVVRRRSDALNALAVALVLMTLVDSATPFELSVQLSFVAVLAMVWLAEEVRAWVPLGPVDRSLWQGWSLRLREWREAVVQTFAASVAVTAATAPLVLLAFQRVSLSGVLSNIITMPVSGALTMLSASGAALFLIEPTLATPMLWAAGGVARAFLWVAHTFGSARWSAVSLPGPTWGVMVAWWSGLLVLVFVRGRAKWLALLSPAALAALMVSAQVPDDRVDVTFLAVGHGDSIVISSGRHHALIDGGGVPNGTDTGQRFVLPFLRHRGIERLDLAALSHAHPDHALGLTSTLEQMPTNSLWLPADVGRGELVEQLIDSADGAKIEEVRAGDQALVGAATLRVLAPAAAREWSDTENDRSMVLLLQHHDVSFLFTGDIEARAEALLDVGSVTVVKAPHHGSDTSSTARFVEHTRPRHVVFCVGQNNRFGFPRQSVVDRYRLAGSRCYRTDLDGAVTFHSDGHDVQVETFAPRQLNARRGAPIRAAR